MQKTPHCYSVYHSKPNATQTFRHSKVSEQRCSSSISRLNLVIPFNDIRIAWRCLFRSGTRSRPTLFLPLSFLPSTLLLRLRGLERIRCAALLSDKLSTTRCLERAVCPAALLLSSILRLPMRRWSAGHVPHGVLALLILRYRGVFGFWKQRDDVPGVEKARQVAKAAEGDVDQRVGGTDATLDPDCNSMSV